MLDPGTFSKNLDFMECKVRLLLKVAGGLLEDWMSFPCWFGFFDPDELQYHGINKIYAKNITVEGRI